MSVTLQVPSLWWESLIQWLCSIWGMVPACHKAVQWGFPPMWSVCVPIGAVLTPVLGLRSQTVFSPLQFNHHDGMMQSGGEEVVWLHTRDYSCPAYKYTCKWSCCLFSLTFVGDVFLHCILCFCRCWCRQKLEIYLTLYTNCTTLNMDVLT